MTPASRTSDREVRDTAIPSTGVIDATRVTAVSHRLRIRPSV
jgi:hypothetical protein